MKTNQRLDHCYAVVVSFYIDDEDNAEPVEIKVKIPENTWKRIDSDKHYTFLQFIDSDGLPIYIRSDSIIAIQQDF